MEAAAVLFVVALVPVLFVGCDGNASAGSPSSSGPTPLLAPLAALPSPSEVPSDARTTAPTAEPFPAECPPAVRLSPRVLSAEWPARLGQRVRLSCRVLRAVGPTEYLVESGGLHFLILADPASKPCTASTSTFVVTGSGRIADRGRTSLPELVVDTCKR